MKSNQPPWKKGWFMIEAGNIWDEEAETSYMPKTKEVLKTKILCWLEVCQKDTVVNWQFAHFFCYLFLQLF